MDAESFTNLALRVIAGEATPDDRRALETELSSAAPRREEFDRLKGTHDLLRATAPLAEAARAAAPELPAHRVNELRTAVRQHFGPAAKRKDVGSTIWAHVLRWVFGGGALAALTFAVVVFSFANRTIEVGLYGSDLSQARGYESLTLQDFTSATLISFGDDASFDAWQGAPLAWNEHAKIWVDNERDLLHIVRRVSHGRIVMETQPLAPTNDGQREQIKQVVAGLEN